MTTTADLLDAPLDGWSGEALVTDTDEPTGARIFIAIHSSRLGPATGGTRMKAYPSEAAALEDALQLAAAMSLKYALAGFPAGGGKAVIAIPEGLDGDADARAGLLRRYGALLRRLGGLFRTGPDVGTSSEDMGLLHEEAPGLVFARPRAQGGAGDSGPWTARGVFCAIEATLRFLAEGDGTGASDRPLAGRRVLVQGAGSVGGRLMERLRDAGAEVLFTDASEAIARRYRDTQGFAFVPPERALETPCDVLAPCALGGVLTADTIPALGCRAVAGAANNPLGEPADADRLRARGILYAPDVLVNAGGAIAITGMEGLGWTETEADAHVRAIGPKLRDVYARAAAEDLTPDAAARAIGLERLRGSP